MKTINTAVFIVYMFVLFIYPESLLQSDSQQIRIDKSYVHIDDKRSLSFRNVKMVKKYIHLKVKRTW